MDISWLRVQVGEALTLGLSTSRHRYICEQEPHGWWSVDFQSFERETRFLSELGRDQLDSYAAAGVIIASVAPAHVDGSSLGRALSAIHASGKTIQDALDTFRLLGFDKACMVLGDGVPLEYAYAI